jgi:hypothetical protein
MKPPVFAVENIPTVMRDEKRWIPVKLEWNGTKWNKFPLCKWSDEGNHRRFDAVRGYAGGEAAPAAVEHRHRAGRGERDREAVGGHHGDRNARRHITAQLASHRPCRGTARRPSTPPPRAD